MKIETSVVHDYVDWGLHEGLREILQNYRDGEAEGFPGTLSFTKGFLEVTSHGVSLPGAALGLLGYSTKRKATNRVGKFGEGLKLGMLALLNAGKTVVVETGGERWTPKIEESTKFPGQRVLVLHVTKRDVPQNNTRVSIRPLRPMEWEEETRHFLFLRQESYVLAAEGVTVIPARAGEIFVGGISLKSGTPFKMGYDFAPGKIKVDRDRRMVDQWDVSYAAADVWRDALSGDHGERWGEVAWGLLLGGSEDTRLLEYRVNDLMLAAVRDRWRATYGELAVPVGDQAAIAQLQFAGARGICVPRASLDVLEHAVGSATSTMRRLGEEVRREYSLEDLSEGEREILTTARGLVTATRYVTGDPTLRVVDFGDQNLLGLYKNGDIYIAKKNLHSFQATVQVLVEEYAHHVSQAGDGKRQHVDAIHMLYSSIINRLVK